MQCHVHCKEHVSVQSAEKRKHQNNCSETASSRFAAIITLHRPARTIDPREHLTQHTLSK